MRTMKLGIAGAGRIAKEFLPTLAQMEDLQITAVWNRSVSAAAQLAAQSPEISRLSNQTLVDWVCGSSASSRLPLSTFRTVSGL